MSVRILNREYGNAYAPTSELKPDWMIGNVGDWIRLKMRIEAGVDFLPTQQDPIYLNKEERSIKIMNGKKWNDYGFDMGANIIFIYKVDTINDEVVSTETFEVSLVSQQIFGDTLIYEPNALMNNIPFDTLPTDRGNMRVYSVKIYDTRDLEGIRMKYTNIENSEVESHTLKSFIDGTETEFINSSLLGLPNNSSWQEMIPIGYQSGMSIEGARIRKVSGGSGGGGEPTPVYESFVGLRQTFELGTRASNIDHRRSWALPINVSGGKPDYQSVPLSQVIPVDKEGTYLNGLTNQCFILNSSTTNEKKFDLVAKFLLLETNKTNPSAHIRLVLVRYNSGTALNFVDTKELKRWSYNEFVNGSYLTYEDQFVLSITAGESYILALEWNHENHSTVTRYIIPMIVDVNCKIYNVEGGIITNYKKQYDIEVDYMISSFFEEITDLENRQPPNVVFDANALTDSVDIILLPEWNNPNIKIQNDPKETERLGNTGWFDENYNGLKNNFKLKELRYENLAGKAVSSLSFGDEIKVIAIIEGVKNLTPDSDFKYGFIWLPVEEEQYKNKTTPFHENTKINNNFSTVAFNPTTNYPYSYEGYSEDNAKMNVRAVNFRVQGNDLVFEAIFTPTQEFRSFFDERAQDRKYAIWVSVADYTLQTSFSDRVSLLLDVRDMVYDIPISGELPNVTNKFIEHPEDNLVAGVVVYDGFLEDDILARSFFTLDRLVRLDQIILGYEVSNELTGLTYELDRFVANTQNYPTVSSGVQEIDFNSTRGYKLAPNNNKNWVKIIRDPASDGAGKFGYKILFAAKTRWEDWIARQNVPVEFFKENALLNGYNNNWLDYLKTSPEHKIKFFILFDVVNGDGINRFKNTFEIKFKGYDENLDFITEHKYFNDTDNTQLISGSDLETGKPMGILLSKMNTRIEITYEKKDSDFDMSNVYAIIGIEIDRGAGVMSYRQLSSIWGSESDNILIPLPENERLRVEQIAPNKIKTSCLVDYTKLSPAARYKITGRIGCFKNNNGIPINNKQYEISNYESKYE